MVGSYELLMMIIRGVQQPAGAVSRETGEVSAGPPDALQVQAAEEFAADVASGRMPSIPTIRTRLHVGQPRDQLVAPTWPRLQSASLAPGTRWCPWRAFLADRMAGQF